MEANSEGASDLVRHEIRLCRINRPEKTPGIVVPTQLFSDDTGHRCLGPVCDHLDRVDEVFALGAKPFELLRFR